MNEYFDKIYVLSLKRNTERRELISERLGAVGIQFEFFGICNIYVFYQWTQTMFLESSAYGLSCVCVCVCDLEYIYLYIACVEIVIEDNEPVKSCVDRGARRREEEVGSVRVERKRERKEREEELACTDIVHTQWRLSV